MTTHTPSQILSALLHTIEEDIIPLTRAGVSSGSKVFGAAILSSTTLTPYTVATNNERISPLLHGEINCIQQFYTTSFPDSSTRPNPATDCIFLATHEPCSLCLSGITWSGFKDVYFLFTHEDSRARFAIPYDIEILEEVFRVRADGEADEELVKRPLYNRENKFFRARSFAAAVLEIDNADERERWGREVERVKDLYDQLSETYQAGKQEGSETASTWK